MNTRRLLAGLAMVVLLASGVSGIELNSSEALKYYGQGTQDFRVSPGGNALIRDGTLNITNNGDAVANFSGTGIDLYKPLSVRSSGPLSVANGIELTGTSSNTIDSFSTFYLSTSSGSASDIVLDPTGQVGVDSNLETAGNISVGGNQLDLEGGDIENAGDIQTGSVSDSDADNEIDFNSNRLTGLKDPNNEQDAATQSYVNSNDDTIQDNQGLEEVLSLDNKVGGENINFNETSNIQASGTNAITLDGNQNIGIPNGNLDLTNNNITQVNRINGQLVQNLGTSSLTEVLNEANKAGNNNINMSGNRITNLSDPTNPQDAATKNYVDTTDNTDDSVSGSNLDGTFSSNGILERDSDNTYSTRSDSLEVAGNSVSLGGSTSVSIDNLSDVSSADESAGQIPIYDGANNEYQNAGISGGTDIGVSTGDASITINHGNTGGASSQDNSGNKFIQDVTVGGNGHVSSLTSSTIEPDEDDDIGVQESGTTVDSSAFKLDFREGIGVTNDGNDEVEISTDLGDNIEDNEVDNDLTISSNGDIDARSIQLDGNTLSSSSSGLKVSASSVLDNANDFNESGNLGTDVVGNTEIDNDDQFDLANTFTVNSQLTADKAAFGVSQSQGGTELQDSTVYVGGNLDVEDDIRGSGGDLAEKVNSSKELEQGEVAVIAGNMSLEESTEAYDTAVAGVISTDPGIVLAKNRDGKNLGLSGIVPVEVTTSNGDIESGDLLTTSNKAGRAMKCRDNDRCENAVIGKAMQSTDTDDKIRVLLTMG